VRRINPDLMIYERRKNSGMNLDKLIRLFDKRGWSALDAVKNRKIIILEENTLAHYGPKFIDNISMLDKKIMELY
jgi:ABC-type Fe3+-hydroxamate transport system substrate-binding protein